MAEAEPGNEITTKLSADLAGKLAGINAVTDALVAAPSAGS